jgi:hypothetical protein
LGDRRIVRRAGLELPAAVWILGVVSAPRDGLTPSYAAVFGPHLVRIIEHRMITTSTFVSDSGALLGA